MKGAIPGPNGGYVMVRRQKEIAMPSVDIIDLKNQIVGTLDLADAVFAAPVNEAIFMKPCGIV